MKNNANRTALLDCGPMNEGIMETAFTSKMQFLSVELERRRSDLTALLHVSEARAREAQENAREIGALIDEAEAMINEAHDKFVSAETRLQQEAALRLLAERKLKVLKEDLRSYPNPESKPTVSSSRITSVLPQPRTETKVISRQKSQQAVVVKSSLNEGMARPQSLMKGCVKLASFGTFLLFILVALFLID